MDHMKKQGVIRRWVVIGILMLAAILAAWGIYGTEFGAALRQREVVRTWLGRWPGLAPVLFIAGYATIGTLAMPVWWMQVIAGYCFGLGMGLAWCLLGDVLSATTSMLLAHWLLGDYLEHRVKPYQAKLRRLDAKLEHNGLLLVVLTRMSFVAPFGISNYLFGLTRMRLVDVIVGTLLGGLLTRMIHVAAGVDWRLLTKGWYLLVLAGVSLVALAPLALCYWRPAWFRRQMPERPSGG
ncbi:MAG TPA: VTT domain-containing protein [Tepidisphaeraceae bacterium]|nr:VTT domain-containing protein [Tepidisphaeraceae bacterium]